MSLGDGGVGTEALLGELDLFVYVVTQLGEPWQRSCLELVAFLGQGGKFLRPVLVGDTVTPMLGGCAVREVYVQNDGVQGESFSAFDAARHRWHQSWITNHGSMLLLDGKIESGRMVLTATDYDKRGDSSLVRGIWIPQRGSVRETATRSRDGGKTWEPLFDIVFRPHKTAAGR